MSARFQVYTSVASLDAPEEDAALRWRLISENGRPLAVCTTGFGTLEDAVGSACAAQRAAPEGAVVFSPPERTGWGWVLVEESDPAAPALALSARRFARRVECVESVSRFRSLAPVAEMPDRVVVFRRAPVTGSAVGA